MTRSPVMQTATWKQEGIVLVVWVEDLCSKMHVWVERAGWMMPF